jgi:urea transporter
MVMAGLGSLIGTLLGVALGADLEGVYAGLWGYNALVTLTTKFCLSNVLGHILTHTHAYTVGLRRCGRILLHHVA